MWGFLTSCLGHGFTKLRPARRQFVLCGSRTHVNYICSVNFTRYFRRVGILVVVFPLLAFCRKKFRRQWSRRVSLNGCLLFRLLFVRDIPPHYWLIGSWHFEIPYWSLLQVSLNPNFRTSPEEYKRTFWGAEMKWNFLKCIYKKKLNQSRYRPGVAQRVPGS